MNTRRMNRLEELGRVDAEKAFTKKGARNLRDEKKRIVRELKKADGGSTGSKYITKKKTPYITKKSELKKFLNRVGFRNPRHSKKVAKFKLAL